MINKRFGSIIGMAAGLALAASASLAMDIDEEPLWLDDLRFQLEDVEDCEVLFLINIDEGKLGGRVTQEARATCADGRQFDAIRILPATDFEFKRCEPQTC